MQEQLFVLKLATILGCGLMAGLFFAFSIAVMRALAQLPPSEGIAAMQAINVAIVNPLFLVVFIGTAVGCVLVMITSLMGPRSANATYAIAGALTYLFGSLVVTAVFNIPRNNALAAISSTDAASAKVWASYLSEWTTWNHVRGIAALVATALLAIGLR